MSNIEKLFTSVNTVEILRWVDAKLTSSTDDFSDWRFGKRINFTHFSIGKTKNLDQIGGFDFHEQEAIRHAIEDTHDYQVIALGLNYLVFKLTIRDNLKTGMVVSLSTALVDSVLANNFPSEKFTIAEKKMAHQLLAGISLRNAALADNVAYETKRAHSKSLGTKMNANGQTDIVRIIMAGLLFGRC